MNERADTLIVHFYPEAMLKQLRDAELKSLPKGKRLEHIEQTQFQIVRQGRGFEVRVESFEFK